MMPRTSAIRSRGRRITQRRLPSARGLAWCLAITIASPASATTRCPPEFGEKSDLFMAMGGLMLSVFFAAGIGVVAFAVKKSRGAALFRRVASLLGAVALMLLLWVAGLALFVNEWVLAC